MSTTPIPWFEVEARTWSTCECCASSVTARAGGGPGYELRRAPHRRLREGPGPSDRNRGRNLRPAPAPLLRRRGSAGCRPQGPATTCEGEDPRRTRSEERRVGKEGVSKCRSRWSP